MRPITTEVIFQCPLFVFSRCGSRFLASTYLEPVLTHQCCIMVTFEHKSLLMFFWTCCLNVYSVIVILISSSPWQLEHFFKLITEVLVEFQTLPFLFIQEETVDEGEQLI